MHGIPCTDKLEIELTFTRKHTRKLKPKSTAGLNLGPFHGFGDFGATRFAYFFPCRVVVLALGTLHDWSLQLGKCKDSF